MYQIIETVEIQKEILSSLSENIRLVIPMLMKSGITFLSQGWPRRLWATVEKSLFGGGTGTDSRGETSGSLQERGSVEDGGGGSKSADGGRAVEGARRVLGLAAEDDLGLLVTIGVVHCSVDVIDDLARVAKRACQRVKKVRRWTGKLNHDCVILS